MKKLHFDSDLYTSVDQLPLSSEDKDRIRCFLDDAERENDGYVNPA
jgi:hypothetical protein